MNFPNGKSEQKEVFPLETRNEKHVSFTSTYEALSFTNLPLNPAMWNFPLLLAESKGISAIFQKKGKKGQKNVKGQNF